MAAGVAAAGRTARGLAARERADARLPEAEVLGAGGVLAGARLVLLGVPDDALAGVVADLRDAWRADHVVVHLSGAHGLAVLAPAAAAGAACLALHPATTFDGPTPTCPACGPPPSGSPRPRRTCRWPAPSSPPWVPSPSRSRTPPARRTTRPSPTGPTTWSRW